MATLEQIYEIESPLEKGFKDLLEAQSLTVRMPVTYVEDDQESDDTQSEDNASGVVAIEVQMGGNVEHGHPTQVAGQNTDDTYNGTLVCTVISDRGQNVSTHRNRIASVRVALMSMDITAFNTAQSYHDLLMLQEGASAHELDDQNNLDLTRLTFNFIAQVKNSVWP